MKAHSSLEPVCDDPRMRHIIHKADGPCECWRCHQLQQQQQQQTPVSTAHSEPTQIGCMQDGCLSQALTYRIDMVNPALEALHRHSSLNSAPSGLQPRPDHVCILGFPSDEGTARNGGRLGGFLGPAHFRQFARSKGTASNPEFGTCLTELNVVDFGNVCPSLSYQTTKERLSALVELCVPDVLLAYGFHSVQTSPACAGNETTSTTSESPTMVRTPCLHGHMLYTALTNHRDNETRLPDSLEHNTCLPTPSPSKATTASPPTATVPTTTCTLRTTDDTAQVKQKEELKGGEARGLETTTKPSSRCKCLGTTSCTLTLTLLNVAMETIRLFCSPHGSSSSSNPPLHPENLQTVSSFALPPSLSRITSSRLTSISLPSRLRFENGFLTSSSTLLGTTGLLDSLAKFNNELHFDTPKPPTCPSTPSTDDTNTPLLLAFAAALTLVDHEIRSQRASPTSHQHHNLPSSTSFDSLREALSVLSQLPSVCPECLVNDARDLLVLHTSLSLEYAHYNLFSSVKTALLQGFVPFCIGGSNDQSAANALALTQVVGAKNVAVINIDAHLDVRPFVTMPLPPQLRSTSDPSQDKRSIHPLVLRSHSGSPFRQLLNFPDFHGDRFVEFAVQGMQCSAQHTQYAESLGAHLIWLSQIKQGRHSWLSLSSTTSSFASSLSSSTYLPTLTHPSGLSPDLATLIPHLSIWDMTQNLSASDDSKESFTTTPLTPAALMFALTLDRLSGLGPYASPSLEGIESTPCSSSSSSIPALPSPAKHIFVSFDIDSVATRDAPGVSCPSPIGLSSEDALGIAFVSGLHQCVSLMDLSELCPKIEGYVTPMLTSFVFYEFLRGRAIRLRSLKKTNLQH